MKGYSLEYCFHSDLLRFHSECLVKAYGAFVQRPDVQGHVVAAAFPRKAEGVEIKPLAHVLSAAPFINAKVVDIKSFYVCQNIVANGSFENAKAVAENASAFIASNENGTLGIAKKSAELGLGIFDSPRAKEIGAPPMMHLKHLREQTEKGWNIAVSCRSYIQFHTFFRASTSAQ